MGHACCDHRLGLLTTVVLHLVCFLVFHFSLSSRVQYWHLSFSSSTPPSLSSPSLLPGMAWRFPWDQVWRRGWVGPAVTPFSTMSSSSTTPPRPAWGTCCEFSSTTPLSGETVQYNHTTYCTWQQRGHKDGLTMVSQFWCTIRYCLWIDSQSLKLELGNVSGCPFY